MKWILVFIYLYDGMPFAELYDEYPNMMECFEGREELGAIQSGQRGYFPQGQQALCIPYDVTDA